jgi:hypothetical protein
MPGKLPSGGGDALEELLVRASCRTSKHVKVLEEAGVVVRTIDGRTHRLDLDLDALGEAVDWIDRQRGLGAHVRRCGWGLGSRFGADVLSTPNE